MYPARAISSLLSFIPIYPPDPSIPFKQLIIPASLFILGVILLLSARRRRAGSIPHCGKCDYVLIGNQSAICPECGQQLTSKTIVKGDRVRPRRFWFALSLIIGDLAAAAIMLTPFIRTYDWYRLDPISWVMKDVRSRDRAQAERAWDELKRRRTVKRLSDLDEQQLVVVALAEQQIAQDQQTPSPILANFLYYLGSCALDGTLSDNQKDQFFRTALHIQLHTRPQVIAGDRYPIEFDSSDRDFLRRFDTQVLTESLVVGTHEEWNEHGKDLQGSTFNTTTHFLKAPPPGDYPITFTFDVRVLKKGFDPGENFQTLLIFRWTVVSKSILHVVAPTPANRIKLIDKPELLSSFRSAIDVVGIGIEPTGDSLQLPIHLKRLPENVAFEAFARANGKEYSIGEFAQLKGQQSTWFLYPKIPKTVTPEKVDIIFRPSERVARETLDIFEIWNGEIEIKDVPFSPDRRLPSSILRPLR